MSNSSVSFTREQEQYSWYLFMLYIVQGLRFSGLEKYLNISYPVSGGERGKDEKEKEPCFKG
jgi:hypothetical protein